MKVCVFGTRGFPQMEGGVEKHCELLYPLLGETTQTVVFRRKPYVKKENSADYNNIRFVDLPSTKIKGVETVIHSFLATLCSVWQKPDVVHIHNIGPAMFAPILKLFSIPVVLTYHSPNYEHKKWGWFARKLLRASEKIALSCANKIIFVNKFQMEKYPEHIRCKSVYLPNGIAPLQITKDCDILKKWKLQPNEYILSVGRITPEKGFHTLIEAFGMLNRDDVPLVIAGGVEFESGYMKKLQALSENVPVVFTGYVYGEALAQLYSHAALFVLASENEGFPMVLLEAMKYERDVLVSDLPATRLVNLDREDYFPSGNVQVLSQKLKDKLEHKCRRVYELDNYNWEVIARETETLLQNAIKQ